MQLIHRAPAPLRSKAIATSSTPLVTTLIHRNCAGSRGSGEPSAKATSTASAIPNAPATRKFVALRMFEKATGRPCWAWRR